MSWVKPVDGQIELSAEITDETMSVTALKRSFRDLIADRSRKDKKRLYYPPQDPQIRMIQGTPNVLRARVLYVERKRK